MGDWVNSGIVGDVKNVENLAVGANSRIEVTKIEQPLAEKLQVLSHAVEAFDGPVEARGRLLAAHSDVVEELQRPEPDKRRILDRLNTIARGAGSASTIVTAASALASAVQLIL
jgi:hypothetical protein